MKCISNNFPFLGFSTCTPTNQSQKMTQSSARMPTPRSFLLKFPWPNWFEFSEVIQSKCWSGSSAGGRRDFCGVDNRTTERGQHSREWGWSSLKNKYADVCDAALVIVVIYLVSCRLTLPLFSNIISFKCSHSHDHLSAGDAQLADSNKHPPEVDANQDDAGPSYVSCPGDTHKYKCIFAQATSPNMKC